jgi:hypothetical protein
MVLCACDHPGNIPQGRTPQLPTLAVSAITSAAQRSKAVLSHHRKTTFRLQLLPETKSSGLPESFASFKTRGYHDHFAVGKRTSEFAFADISLSLSCFEAIERTKRAAARNNRLPTWTMSLQEMRSLREFPRSFSFILSWHEDCFPLLKELVANVVFREN